ncbi:MAG TPA: hypothetical protein VIK97_06605 [Casimicrobiaceae bacterium]
MAISTSRKMNMIGLATLLLAGTVVSWWPIGAARWQMHRFCTGLAPGTSAARVAAEANERGYEITTLPDGRMQFDDPRTLGRGTCVARFGAQGLVSAE